MIAPNARPGCRWHFVGIGGVGMNGLALLAHQRGLLVAGSDITPSPIVDRLRRNGLTVHPTCEPGNLAPDVDAVVITTIIPEDNAEVLEARRRDIPVLHRSEALALLADSRQYIGVVGSAGKGTTAGAVVAVLERDGAYPGFYLGWNLRDRMSSAWDGDGWMVLELDESDGSMRNFSPDVVIVTNLYREHLDYYPNLESMVEEFQGWLESNDRLATVVINVDDPGCRMIAERVNLSAGTVVTYGFGSQLVDYRGSALRATVHDLDFTLRAGKHPPVQVTAPLGMPYNGSNLLAAAAGTHRIGINLGVIAAGLTGYQGISDRVEVTERDGLTFVSAYAAVPESVAAVVEQLCASFGPDDVLVVFQPNRSWRLNIFFHDYAVALRPAGTVIVTDLAMTYPGQTRRHAQLEREHCASIPTRTEPQLVAAIGGRARYVAHDDLAEVLRTQSRLFTAVAVLAGGEYFLDRMRCAVIGDDGAPHPS